MKPGNNGRTQGVNGLSQDWSQDWCRPTESWTSYTWRSYTGGYALNTYSAGKAKIMSFPEKQLAILFISVSQTTLTTSEELVVRLQLHSEFPAKISTSSFLVLVIFLKPTSDV